MHANVAEQFVSCSTRVWGQRLLQVVVGVGCLIAGAALVMSSSPGTPLAAQSRSGETVLLDFTATWCGPCQQMSPIVDRLAQQGYPIRKVDVDQHRAIADRYQVTSMPTFVLVVQGQEVMRQSGVTSEAQLRRMLQQIPQWEKELVAQQAPPARALPVQAASADPAADFGLSPFSVDLGNSEGSAAVTDNRPRNRLLPFLPKTQRSQPAGPDTTSPVVRAQSGDNRVPAEAAAVREPLRASVRLCVQDKQGAVYGSGTIIESRVGRTLILTCGHVFQQLSKDGVIQVDVFIPGQNPINYVGQVVKVDEEADVGLVAIPTAERLPTISLSSLDRPLEVGQSLVSFGCSGGENPSREAVEVTAVNKYVGPDSVECTGFPALGRSGGGLFRGQELVAVCIAHDAKTQRGVFTTLKPIYDLLEQAGSGHLLPVGRPAAAPVVAQTDAPAASPFDTPVATIPPIKSLPIDDAVPAILTNDEVLSQLSRTPAGSGTATSVSDLKDVLHQAPDSEIICIVRPKSPKVPSRVVIIHEASPKLISYLLDSGGDLPASPKDGVPVMAEPGTVSTATLVPTSAVAPSFREVTAMPQVTKPLRPVSPR